MHSRSGDLPDQEIAAAVSAAWMLPPTTASYWPVGYGSHHWRVEDGTGGRWFASVDSLGTDDPRAAFDRLAAAQVAAVTAREAGLPFVVAPLRTPDGSVLRRLRGRYALALYPFLTGRSGAFDDNLSDAEGSEL